MTLNGAEVGTDYQIRDVCTEDDEMRSFLFSLGCYCGEEVTVVSRKRGGMVVAIRDGRYSIDPDMAEIIEIEAS